MNSAIVLVEKIAVISKSGMALIHSFRTSIYVFAINAKVSSVIQTISSTLFSCNSLIKVAFSFSLLGMYFYNRSFSVVLFSRYYQPTNTVFMYHQRKLFSQITFDILIEGITQKKS